MKVYVISGGPGTGKTSVVNELAKQGYSVFEEAAREIGENDLRFKGKSVKDIGVKEFHEAIFQFQKKQITGLKNNKIVFSDRGLGDTISYYNLHKLKVPEELKKYIKKFRYAGVFILEKLNFYEKDNFRQEEREEQERIHNLIIETYEELGYKIVKVPFMGVEDRVKFIKRTLF